MSGPFPGFMRWAFPSAAIIGDYLYVDGGEVARRIDGKIQNPPSAQVNSTLSLSLNNAWKNSTAEWIETSRAGVPKLKESAFWVDPSTKSFYAWAGSTSYFLTPPENQLWRFAADGAGSGSWSQVASADVVSFGALVKPAACASASGKDRTGYCVGGYLNRFTDTTVSGDAQFGIPGAVTFDMEKRVFTNHSTEGLDNGGISIGASAQSVPFGPDADSRGLLAVFGGGDAWTMQYSFQTVSIFDPAQSKWYTQATTGSRPSPRSQFCSVGARGDNGTYEIFLYGGVEWAGPATSSEVFILSLPGFVFFKAPAALSTPRATHSCAADGRQMISVGGTYSSKPFPNSLTDRDPWNQGLGVFDMTELRWRDGFDATRPAYRTPKVVKEWYNQNGLKSVAWSSDVVKGLFSTAPPASSPQDPPAGTDRTTDPNPSAGSSTLAPSMSAGAIAGAVIGGVAGLAITVALLVFFVLRRRRQLRQRQSVVQIAAQHSGSSEKKPFGARTSELPGHPAAAGAYTTPELPGRDSQIWELAGPTPELCSDGPVQELSTQNAPRPQY